MTKSVIDWTDIRGSLERELGEDSHGWIDQIEIGLRQLRREVEEISFQPGEGTQPCIVQVKQKSGDLGIYSRCFSTFDTACLTEIWKRSCESEAFRWITPR